MHHPVPGLACGEVGYGLGETRKLDDRFWGVLVRQCEKKRRCPCFAGGRRPLLQSFKIQRCLPAKGGSGGDFFFWRAPSKIQSLDTDLARRSWPSRPGNAGSQLQSGPHFFRPPPSPVHSPKSPSPQATNKVPPTTGRLHKSQHAHLHHCVIAPISER